VNDTTNTKGTAMKFFATLADAKAARKPGQKLMKVRQFIATAQTPINAKGAAGYFATRFFCN
jgi:hypothetical protein